MRFVPGLPANSNISQEVVVYFLLFHDGLNSPTRRVTHILLNQTNTRQELPNEIWTNSDPLSLPVTEGSFIGLAVPDNRSPTMFTKGIKLSPGSLKPEAYLHIPSVHFNEFEERVLEVARTADSSQFTTLTVPLPLIDVSFGKCTIISPYVHVQIIYLYAHQLIHVLEIIKIFYKNSKDVGMAQKVQKQVKAVTQWSINHGPYMQECRTLLSYTLECRDDG